MRGVQSCSVRRQAAQLRDAGVDVDHEFFSAERERHGDDGVASGGDCNGGGVAAKGKTSSKLAHAVERG